jgi:hypothetical protein
VTHVKGEVQESYLELFLLKARVFKLSMAKGHVSVVGWFAGRTWTNNNEWYN